MLGNESVDGRSAIGAVEAPVSLGAKGPEELVEVDVDVLGRAPSLSGVEEPFVVRYAIAQLADIFESEIELCAIGSGGPCGVKVRDSQVALPAPVGHVRPETKHEAGDYLVGVRRVVGAAASVLHGATVH